MTDAEAASYAATVAAATPTIDQVRQPTIDRGNSEAAAARTKYITAIAGQEQTYQLKADEASAYLTAAAAVTAPATYSPAAGTYPYLEAEAVTTGTTLAALAASVAATATQWTSLNVKIESLRRGAVVRIAAAPDQRAIQAVFPIAWP
ncbi:MAG: hypothetical protein F8N39_05820 [Clostridiaceae bacterium]|nr:hypothetical protein [Clostridiaceae bacterium]